MTSPEEMRLRPLTAVDMDRVTNSAHAFWEQELKSDCHPFVGGAKAFYKSGGTIEMFCRKCGALVGVFSVAKS